VLSLAALRTYELSNSLCAPRQPPCVAAGVAARALRDTRGFALLEVFIAAAILATALLSLAQLIAFATRATAEAGRTTYAALLAMQKIEELHAASWSELQPGTDSPAAGFTRMWSIAPFAGDPDYVALVEVVVQSRGGEARIVALKTKEDP
jgi:Tfp pilus assembly protein PilE